MPPKDFTGDFNDLMDALKPRDAEGNPIEIRIVEWKPPKLKRPHTKRNHTHWKNNGIRRTLIWNHVDPHAARYRTAFYKRIRNKLIILLTHHFGEALNSVYILAIDRDGEILNDGEALREKHHMTIDEALRTVKEEEE